MGEREVFSPATAGVSCGEYYLDAQDTQIPYLKHWSIVRSNVVTNFASAVRLPASNLAAPIAYRALVEQYHALIPEHCRPYNRGTLFLGDIGDTAAVPELGYFLDAQREVEARHPDSRVLLMPPGNHEAFPNGTFATGGAFWGLLSFFTKVEGPDRSYIQNIATPEVGESGNLLDKMKYLQFVYQYQGWPWKPVLLGQADKSTYELKGEQGIHRWDKTADTLKHYWKKGSGGRDWQILVKFRPDEELRPEQQWLHLAARRLDPPGAPPDAPVFLIGLDFVDFLKHSSTDGATRGHVSYIQTKIVRAFIEEMKKSYPRAKFVLASHYPVEDQQGFEIYSPSTWVAPPNGFEEVLKDESVVLSLVGHTHKWNYADLNSGEVTEELGIEGQRRTPLPQVNGPSLIDSPLGGWKIRMRYEGAELVFEFDKITFDREAILARASPLVREEYERNRSHLLIYPEGLRNNPNALSRLFGIPSVPLGDKIARLLDTDVGKLDEPGRIHDHIQSEDVLPLMEAAARERMRLYMGALRLALHDVGLGAEGDRVATVFYQDLDNLYTYYQETLKGYAELSAEGAQARRAFKAWLTYYGRVLSGEIDPDQVKWPPIATSAEVSMDINRHTEAYLRALGDLLVAIRRERERPETDPRRTAVLEKIESMTLDMRQINSVYQVWLMVYEMALLARKTPDEVAQLNFLLAFGAWERIEQTIRSLPYEGSTTPFLLASALEAAELRNFYLRKLPKTEAPVRIRIAVNLNTNAIKMTAPIAPLSDEELDRIHEGMAAGERFSGIAGMAARIERKTRKQLEVPYWIGHASADLAYRVAEGSDSWIFGLGYQGHWFPGDFSLWRITSHARAQFHTDGPRGREWSLSVSPQFDLLGKFSIGPLAGVGMTFGNDAVGNGVRLVQRYGGAIDLYEGAIRLQVAKEIHDDAPDPWMTTVGVDPFGVLRLFNRWPRHR